GGDGPRGGAQPVVLPGGAAPGEVYGPACRTERDGYPPAHALAGAGHECDVAATGLLHRHVHRLSSGSRWPGCSNRRVGRTARLPITGKSVTRTTGPGRTPRSESRRGTRPRRRADCACCAGTAVGHTGRRCCRWGRARCADPRNRVVRAGGPVRGGRRTRVT